MPAVQKAGVWNEMKTFLVPFAFASSSHCFELLHLLFVDGLSSEPPRRVFIVVRAGPQEDEATP